MTKIIRNQKTYDSEDVTVLINGIPIELTEISYNTEKEHQVNYGLGEKPTSWSGGKRSFSCSIGVAMHHIIDLENAAKDKDLISIKPFDINVSYFNEYNQLVNDTIVAKFKDQGREVNGEMGLQKTYELFVLEIEYNNI